MIKQFQYYIASIALFVLVTGCASHYTNKELHHIFQNEGFNVKETDRGIVVFLPEVFFKFDSTELTRPAHEDLQFVGEVLSDPKALSRLIYVEGHTDSIGDSSYNEALSLRRSNVVADSLVSNNVSDDRITRRGFGMKYPIAPNTMPDGTDNPEGRTQNRRVEIVVEENNVQANTGGY
ncbi:MAG: OmpA family protein [Betaproteobacteria bacterium]|nr:OmpA family protein [Betaproteobacteria bacterium]